MKKFFGFLLSWALAAACFYGGTLAADRHLSERNRNLLWWGVLFPQTWAAEPVSASSTENAQPQIRLFFPEKLGQVQNWLRGRS